MVLKQICKNKLVFYLASRYLTYFIQFVTSLVIAAELGPYYMGIWGFVLLILNYFQQFHFGIANSFNVLYVHHRDNKNECDNYIINSMVLLVYLSLLVIAFYIFYRVFGLESFEKYHADKYIIWICIIGILQYFVQFFINLFRVKNQLNRVTFCQSIIVFLNFACIIFFKGEELIQWLIASYIVGNIVCVIVAFFSGSVPIRRNIIVSFDYQWSIIKKGLFLFLYNSCFYFIIISIRTIISSNYSVEEFGMFTFSFSLAHAILLVLEALSFIIFPKVIGKLSSTIIEEVETTISMLRVSYITSAHLLIYIALPLFPIILYFLPKYEGAITTLNLIALSILMEINTYGYLELLISRNKEKTAAALSSFALILNCIIAFILVFIFYVGFSYVILATMITYFVFSFLVIKMSQSLLKDCSFKQALISIMPIRLVVPYATALILSVFSNETLMWVPLIIFIILNAKVLIQIKDIIIKLMVKPEIVDMK